MEAFAEGKAFGFPAPRVTGAGLLALQAVYVSLFPGRIGDLRQNHSGNVALIRALPLGIAQVKADWIEHIAQIAGVSDQLNGTVRRPASSGLNSLDHGLTKIGLVRVQVILTAQAKPVESLEGKERAHASYAEPFIQVQCQHANIVLKLVLYR